MWVKCAECDSELRFRMCLRMVGSTQVSAFNSICFQTSVNPVDPQRKLRIMGMTFNVKTPQMRGEVGTNPGKKQKL